MNSSKKSLIHRRDPIIILGTHRSGTSLLGELLSDIGVFMGRKQNVHHEAWHFLNNNKKILEMAHSDWDIPLVFESLLRSEQTSLSVLKFMDKETSQKKMVRHFFGKKLALKEKILPTQTMWGWKDPRTSITFPFWYKIFPDARFIRLIRNGADVANSINLRERKNMHRIHSYASSTRCQSIQESFRVWEEYNEYFFRYKNLIPDDKIFNLKYEDLLDDSIQTLEKIALFINLKKPKEIIITAAKRINHKPVNNYRSDKLQLEFYEKVKNTKWMKEFGY